MRKIDKKRKHWKKKKYDPEKLQERKQGKDDYHTNNNDSNNYNNDDINDNNYNNNNDNNYNDNKNLNILK